jgi:hypothetical protein
MIVTDPWVRDGLNRIAWRGEIVTPACEAGLVILVLGWGGIVQKRRKKSGRARV